jgi:hypothetical protein
MKAYSITSFEQDQFTEILRVFHSPLHCIVHSLSMFPTNAALTTRARQSALEMAWFTAINAGGGTRRREGKKSD